MWRKKRGGRYVGSWRATVRGEEVNLATKNAEEARIRLREAVQRGRRNFVDDADAAAASMQEEAGGEGGGGVEDPSVSAAGRSAPAVPPSPPPPPPPPAPAPIQPDAYIPPSSSAPPDDMAAAAAEVGGGDAGGAAGSGPGPEAFGPEQLRAVIALGAGELVRLQVYLQGRVAERLAGAEPPPVTMDAGMKDAVTRAWEQQLEIWLPKDLPLAPWMVALALPLLYFPAQLAGAQEAAKAAENAGKAAA